MTNKFTGAANSSSINPYEAKASTLVIKYPKRHIFPNKNDNQKNDFPMLMISSFFIIKIFKLELN